MTKKTFLECVNGVDDDLIENVEMPNAEKVAERTVVETLKPKKRNKIRFFKYVAAACIIIVFSTGIAFNMIPPENMKVGERNTIKVTEQMSIPTGETETTELTDILALNNVEFSYNNKNYKVISDKEFLYSNNLRPGISKSDIGSTLEKNILDTSGNNVLGDLYSYKNSSNQDIVILKANDGSYNFAFFEEETK